MENNQPQIAVVLPVYNGMAYLQQAVESVLSQTFSGFEFIICDDTSTDGSYETLKFYKDARIKLYRNNKNLGLFPTLNELIGLSQAPLIHLWSQDDIMEPACLEKTLAFHALQPEISMSYSGRFTIDENNRQLSSSILDNTPELIWPQLYAEISALHGCMPGNIANVTIVRFFVNQTGYFNEDLKVSGDFDMWTRLAENHPIGFIKDKLISIRKHRRQLSRNPDMLLRFLQEDLPIFEELYNRIHPNLQQKIRKHYEKRYRTLYMNNFFYLIAKHRFSLAFQYIKTLLQYQTAYALFVGWLYYRIKK